MYLALYRLMLLTYQASDFNNWEKWDILLYVFIIHNGRFSFELNFIPLGNSTSFIPGWKPHVNINFFIQGWDFISVTCKCTLCLFVSSKTQRPCTFFLANWLLWIAINKFAKRKSCGYCFRSFGKFPRQRLQWRSH